MRPLWPGAEDRGRGEAGAVGIRASLQICFSPVLELSWGQVGEKLGLVGRGGRGGSRLRARGRERSEDAGSPPSAHSF